MKIIIEKYIKNTKKIYIKNYKKYIIKMACPTTQIQSKNANSFTTSKVMHFKKFIWKFFCFPLNFDLNSIVAGMGVWVSRGNFV